jgi:transcriptional regulator with XRE-family HTH domain
MNAKYDKTQVGQRLKEFRQSINMSQKDFAQSLNWTYESYRKIETGKVLLTTDKIQQLYSVYHIDICYILTGEYAYFSEISDDSLLNLRLCSTDDQWSSMQIRMFQYFLNAHGNL